jgi:surface antigen
MTRAKATLAITLLSASLGACSSPAPAPTTLAAPAKTLAAPAESTPPPPAAGVLDGQIGQSLDERDRNAAIGAQQEAVSSGTRKSWRGSRGAYGFVTPGPENGDCREYTHKIFMNGRPREARGQACRDNGAWRIKN